MLCREFGRRWSRKYVHGALALFRRPCGRATAAELRIVPRPVFNKQSTRHPRQRPNHHHQIRTAPTRPKATPPQEETPAQKSPPRNPPRPPLHRPTLRPRSRPGSELHPAPPSAVAQQPGNLPHHKRQPRARRGHLRRTAAAADQERECDYEEADACDQGCGEGDGEE